MSVTISLTIATRVFNFGKYNTGRSKK